MYITINVYPEIPELPDPQKLLDLSMQRLWARLKEYSIKVEPLIHVSLKPIAPDMAGPPIGPEGRDYFDVTDYAWFTVGQVPGGSDAYVCSAWDEDLEYWSKTASTETRPLYSKRMRRIYSYLVNGGKFVYFGCPMPQPSYIHLAFGLIAASFAELTNGLLFSDDGAWDYKRFPATAEEFDACYFRPEMAISQEYKQRAEYHINNLIEMLGN